MAASDHIHPYIKAYHISEQETPPHELDPHSLLRYSEWDNTHPDVLHMGSRKAAIHIQNSRLYIPRNHLHEYEIDPSIVHPVIYGDSQSMLDISRDIEDSKAKNIDKHMAGIQPELWESIPGDPREAVKTGQVLPYRNFAEDIGSISYMVPKSAIKEGKVRYVGVKDIQEERKNG